MAHANSILANQVVEPIKVSDKQKILSHIERFGEMTLDELERVMGKARHKFSGRLTDLKAEGKIEEIANKKKGSSTFSVYALVKPKPVANPGMQGNLF